jgi:hypothetical protein
MPSRTQTVTASSLAAHADDHGRASDPAATGWLPEIAGRIEPFRLEAAASPG